MMYTTVGAYHHSSGKPISQRNAVLFIEGTVA